MQKILNKIWMIVALSSLSFLLVQTVIAQEQENILYYGDGCAHCIKVEIFLKENNLENMVVKREVYRNSVNAMEFNQVCDKYNIELNNRGVPFLYTGNEYFVGDVDIINYFQNIDKVDDTRKKNTEEILPVLIDDNKHKLTLSLLVGAAIVDAINPCAFAVLLILMTTILATQSRKKALYSGLAFSFSIFLSYLLMGLGLYSVIASFETTHIFIIIVGIIAILLGLFNIKDYLWYGKGFLMEVPLSWRNKLKSIIQSIVNPIGAFFIGGLISLFLLPCTGGPYIVIISMLGQGETFFHAFWLLILYNLIFILPMLAITIAVYFGIDVNKAEELRQTKLKQLHLIAGIIMLVMGTAILIYYV